MVERDGHGILMVEDATRYQTIASQCCELPRHVVCLTTSLARGYTRDNSASWTKRFDRSQKNGMYARRLKRTEMAKRVLAASFDKSKEVVGIQTAGLKEKHLGTINAR